MDYFETGEITSSEDENKTKKSKKKSKKETKKDKVKKKFQKVQTRLLSLSAFEKELRKKIYKENTKFLIDIYGKYLSLFDVYCN